VADTVPAEAPGERSVPRSRGPRFFATPADEPRARRASDVTMLVTTTFALVAVSAAAEPRPGISRAVAQLLAALPDLLDLVWQLAADLLIVLAVALLVTALVRRRLAVARDIVLAAALALAVSFVAGRIVIGSWPDVWDAMRAAGPPPWYPAMRIALPAAAIATASPHVTAPVRRLGRWVIGVAMIGLVALGASTPLGVLAGLLLAGAAAAAVHLVFGSTAGRPGLGVVRDALDDVGIDVVALAPASRQQSGAFVVSGTEADGGALAVKVYGRDAHDAAVLSTLWRTIWYRDAVDPLRVGRARQVEYEALVTLLAAQAGVVTDTVVSAGETVENDAVLVLRTRGRPLEATDESDDVVVALWELLARLHRAGIAHGRVDLGHLFLTPEGELGLRDFRSAALDSSPTQRTVDRAQALVTSVMLVGQERAVALAGRCVAPDVLAAMLPVLQRPVLTPDQRRRVAADKIDLNGLRAGVAASIDSELPALQELRRVSPGSIVRVVLPAAAVLALFSMLTGLDLAELGELLREASWWLLLAGVVLAQAPRLSQAVSTLGAAPVQLPLGPVYALQLAVSYINLAIPSTAGRVAVNIRFFQRHGMAPGTALAAGALDGVSGFVVQAIVLVTIILLTPASLDIDARAAVDSAAWLIIVALVIAAAAIAVVLLVRRVRRFALGWARRLTAEAGHALRGLRSPRRLALLFGGNLATEVLFALALGTFVAAFGHPIGFGELLLTNISVALLAGLLPVPGGIGVAEGGLTFGLVQAGVPEEAAFAAVLMYRMATFYLPPLWGYVAMRWLERNEHL
jgi:uncharacterized protein (TIRG00374 family)